MPARKRHGCRATWQAIHDGVVFLNTAKPSWNQCRPLQSVIESSVLLVVVSRLNMTLHSQHASIPRCPMVTWLDVWPFKLSTPSWPSNWKGIDRLCKQRLLSTRIHTSLNGHPTLQRGSTWAVVHRATLNPITFSCRIDNTVKDQVCFWWDLDSN